MGIIQPFCYNQISGLDDPTGNTLEVTFLVSANVIIFVGEAYHVTFGISKDSYEKIWISDHSLSGGSLVTPKQYNTSGTIISYPTQMKMGEAQAILVNLTSELAISRVNIRALSPDGTSNKFHLSQINAEFEDSYSCTDIDSFEHVTKESTFDSKYKGWSQLTIPKLVNSEAKTANPIQFVVPIMAIKGVDSPGLHTVGVSLVISDTDILSFLADIEILNEDYPPVTSTPVQSVSGGLVDSVVYYGGAAVVRTEIKISLSQVADIEVISSSATTGVKPIVTTLFSTGTCSFIEDRASLLTGSSLTTKLGKCTCTVQATTVIVDVAFSIASNTSDSSATVSISVGGVSLAGDITFPLSYPPMVPDTISVVAEAISFENTNVHPDTGLGISLKFTLPPTSLPGNIMIEIYSGLSDPTLKLQLCHAEIVSVGNGLPCLKGSKTTPVLATNANSSYFATWDLGHSCPISKGSHNGEAHIVFHIPNQEFYSTTYQLNPSFGIKLGSASPSITVVTATTTVDTIKLSGIEVKSGMVASGVFISNYNLPPLYVTGPGHILHDRFVLKVEPKTRASYSLVITPDSDARVCRIITTHIGKNMPCAKTFTDYIDEYSSINKDYGDKGYGTVATAQLGVLSNWGGTSLIKDLYSDRDTVEILVFAQHNNPTNDLATAKVLDVAAKYGSISKKTIKDYILYANLTLNDNNTLNLNPRFISTIDKIPSTGGYKGMAKVVALIITVPKTFKGPVNIQFKNTAFAEETFEFGDIRITKSGLNVPCIDDNIPIKVTKSTTITSDMHEIIQAEINLQHYLFTKDDAESEVHVELTVLIPKTYSKTSIDVEATIVETAETSVLTLAVEDAPSSLANASAIYDDLKITVGNFIEMDVGEMVWIPFNITIPKYDIIPFNFEVVTPCSDHRAVLTVQDVRFAQNKSNVCCFGHHINFTAVYGAKFEGVNTTKFMQHDKVVVDMNYVYNAHYSVRREFGTPDDLTLNLEVLVQLTDHQLTAHMSTHSVFFVGRSENTIATAYQDIKVRRKHYSMRTKESRALIWNKMTLLNADTEYETSNEVNIESSVFHVNYSKAEAHDKTVVKIILPTWLELKPGSCSTNYTVDSQCKIEPVTDVTSFNIIFDTGIYFSSYIDLKFTLIVGSGIPAGETLINSAIMSFTECSQSAFNSFPSEPVRCGAVSYLNVKVKSPPCSAPITSPSCAFSASSALDNDTLPGNVVTDDSKVWSPAVRSAIFGEFIIVNHVETLELTAIDIKFTGEAGYSLPTKIIVDSSMTGYSWKTVAELDSVSLVNNIMFTSQEKGKKWKITCMATGNPFGVSYVSLKGCPLSSSSGTCPSNIPKTMVSTQSGSYRHLALDSINLILYFCDVDPTHGRLFCYSIKSGETTFKRLPTYVAAIAGFSPSTKKMYLKEKALFLYIVNKYSLCDIICLF